MILEGDERAEERRLILDGAWPHFPMLPVKRDRKPRGGNDTWPELGVIVWRYVPPGEDKTAGPWTVFIGNMLAMVQDAKTRYDGQRVTWAQALEGAGNLKYATLDDFFDDGWRAD